ncbi:hypothetical protein A3850_013340 [Lewinella sp. 4G2]|nr:hypothetical protein A3850_013340 [Lewinella sp. 4G2]
MGNIKYEDQSISSLKFSVDGPADEIEEAWEDYFDERYDLKLDKLDKDRGSIAYRNENATLTLLTSKPVTLYSKVAEIEGGAQISVAMTDANGAYTETNNATAMLAVRAMIEDFKNRFYTDYFDEQLEDARKELEDARDDSQDDTKDAERARKKIEKYRDKIADYEKKIQDLRDEVGDELLSAEEEAARAARIEDKIREIQVRRARYLGQ